MSGAIVPKTTTATATSAGRDLALRRRLLRWFDAHRRDLPWRRNRDSYRVWVAEVMLQQTRVEVVTPAYERFLGAFPDLASLARASEERVLSLWSGLGYYARARSLHRAARALVAEGHAAFPSEREQARRLPGVGAYTAAAVLSIAYDVPLAAVDGNVVRVLSRLERLALPDGRGEPHASLAQRLLDRRRPGDWNQAMMELGQAVCTPRSPCCGDCPILDQCHAARDGAVAAHPPVKPRRTVERHALRLAVLRDPRGDVALERGVFAHLPEMWLPLVEEPGGSDERVSRRRRSLRHAGSFRHAIQHRLFDVEVRAAIFGRDALERLVRGRRPSRAERRLFTPHEMASIGRSSLLSKAIALAERAAMDAATDAASTLREGTRPRRTRVQDDPHRDAGLHSGPGRGRVVAEPATPRPVGSSAPGGRLSDRR